eukprot:gnl/Dysnectes_brevis/2896_a3538_536.p1 GENE.gnl/Dysnectes_brevis/2896_a3538_536~~gnl/Dysnectes_brevis/2896_a3538_536.p1  ORF type:complete len:679 (-),score=184.60 gnl/Dysnectes_brevis/2896_a3538_536:1262-3298(-)
MNHQAFAGVTMSLNDSVISVVEQIKVGRNNPENQFFTITPSNFLFIIIPNDEKQITSLVVINLASKDSTPKYLREFKGSCWKIFSSPSGDMVVLISSQEVHVIRLSLDPVRILSSNTIEYQHQSVRDAILHPLSSQHIVVLTDDCIRTYYRSTIEMELPLITASGTVLSGSRSLLPLTHRTHTGWAAASLAILDYQGRFWIISPLFPRRVPIAKDLVAAADPTLPHAQALRVALTQYTSGSSLLLPDSLLGSTQENMGFDMPRAQGPLSVDDPESSRPAVSACCIPLYIPGAPTHPPVLATASVADGVLSVAILGGDVQPCFGQGDSPTAQHTPPLTLAEKIPLPSNERTSVRRLSMGGPGSQSGHICLVSERALVQVTITLESTEVDVIEGMSFPKYGVAWSMAPKLPGLLVLGVDGLVPVMAGREVMPPMLPTAQGPDTQLPTAPSPIVPAGKQSLLETTIAAAQKSEELSQYVERTLAIHTRSEGLDTTLASLRLRLGQCEERNERLIGKAQAAADKQHQLSARLSRLLVACEREGCSGKDGEGAEGALRAASEEIKRQDLPELEEAVKDVARRVSDLAELQSVFGAFDLGQLGQLSESVLRAQHKAASLAEVMPTLPVRRPVPLPSIQKPPRARVVPRPPRDELAGFRVGVRQSQFGSGVYKHMGSSSLPSSLM